LFVAFALAAGCSSGSRPDVSEAGVSNLCITSVCTPDPNGVCQHTCSPDPGPALVDCTTAEANYDFSGGPVGKPLWTFEAQDGGNAANGYARGMYSYTDNTTIIQTFTTPDPADPLGKNRLPKTWEPPVAVMPRCWDPNDHSKPLDPMNHAIHIQGGPFLSWGGGIGIGMKNFPSVTGSVTDPSWQTINNMPSYPMQDVSSFEGVSFWARRGPDSQAGIRVLVGDKYTDDDISYLMYRDDPTQPRYCERVRECACLQHRSCVAVHLDRPTVPLGKVMNPLIPDACKLDPSHLQDLQSASYCGTPEVINGAASSQAGGSQCNTCAETRCNERWPAFPDDQGLPLGATDPSLPTGIDRQYYGKTCSPYTMRNGISSYWCFDPATEKPAETTEQCGDHWTHVVNLSNEWQFYTVPFTQMAQQGWSQRTAALTTQFLSVVRFTWDGGYIDYWIDDVRFYRHKPAPPPQTP
jgi:hypothetical protein